MKLSALLDDVGIGPNFMTTNHFKPLTNQTIDNLTTGNIFANALVFSIIV
ncbi:MAG: hypothetical protein Q8R83_02325 [Legionellaceae bacterium]|nr:hypothetical protein [Legionellaceae bacterium]